MSVIKIIESKSALSEAIVAEIEKTANAILSKQDKFFLAVSGGSLIEIIHGLSKLSEDDVLNWHVFLCDERYAPRDDVDNTFHSYQTLLLECPFLSRFVVPDTDLSLKECAKVYEENLKSIVKTVEDIPQFDLIVLDAGSDGHVCSLFPESHALQCEDSFVTYITDSPKFPPERVTFTSSLLKNAKEIFLVLTGDSKSDLVHSLLCNKDNSMPVSMIAFEPSTSIYLDNEASLKYEPKAVKFQVEVDPVAKVEKSEGDNAEVNNKRRESRNSKRRHYNKLSVDVNRQELRKHIWNSMEKSDHFVLYEHPRPCYGKIPRFLGCAKAAYKLASTMEFQRARVIKVNPSLAQMEVRYLALWERKTLYVPNPMLQAGFFYKLKGNDIGNYLCRRASTVTGAQQLGRPMNLTSKFKHIDLFVVGSVAVAPNGVRLGKGSGYAEIEWAILTHLGVVDQNTVVATTVHESQIVSDKNLPVNSLNPHDLPVDLIITPSTIINVKRRLRKPTCGVIWNILSEAKEKSIPILSELKANPELCNSIKAKEPTKPRRSKFRNRRNSKKRMNGAGDAVTSLPDGLENISSVSETEKNITDDEHKSVSVELTVDINKKSSVIELDLPNPTDCSEHEASHNQVSSSLSESESQIIKENENEIKIQCLEIK